MNGDEQDRLKKLLQQALPPVQNEPEPGRDLWPTMLRRLDSGPAKAPWYDWALLAGLVGLAGLFPAAIPVFFYYL